MEDQQFEDPIAETTDTPQEDSTDLSSAQTDYSDESSGEDVEATSNSDLAAKREAGKLQQIQKEYEQLKSQFQNVSQWVAQDPERFKRALVETSGYSDYEAEQLTRQQFPQWQGSLTRPTQGYAQSYPQAPVIDPVKKLAADELLAEKERAIRERQEHIKDFLTKHPELSREENQLIFQAAGMIERAAKGTLTAQQAIDLAYKRNFRPEQIEKEALEKGELQGLSQASSIASSIYTPPKSGVTKSESEPYVEPNEWAAAQKLGFKSKSEYSLYRDNSRLMVN